MAVVRTEYDYAVSPVISRITRNCSLNHKKEKMKGGLGWMKNIGSDHRSLFNGNHFSSSYTMGSRGISE